MLYEPLFYQQNGGTCGPVCQTLILMIRATGRCTCLLKLVDRVLLHDVAQIQKLRLPFFYACQFIPSLFVGILCSKA